MNHVLALEVLEAYVGFSGPFRFFFAPSLPVAGGGWTGVEDRPRRPILKYIQRRACNGRMIDLWVSIALRGPRPIFNRTPSDPLELSASGGKDARGGCIIGTGASPCALSHIALARAPLR